MLLSVIIPVYNAERYLPSCIDSVLAHGGDSLEVILVDDGSTDASGRLCDEYAARDKRIQVQHQPNQGVSVARNAGLQVAQGEWISFVDADDEVMSGYAESCQSLDAATDVAYFAHEGYLLHPVVCRDTSSIEQEILRLKTDPSGFEFYGYTWNKFFRASIIHEHHLAFPIGISHREDELFTTEFCHYAKQLEVLSHPLYRYRIDNNGAHLTKRVLGAAQLLPLAANIEHHASYWQTSELKAYDLYRSLYMLYDALRRTKSVWKQRPIAARICCFVEQYRGLYAEQGLPKGFIKSADSTWSLLWWINWRKLIDRFSL